MTAGEDGFAGAGPDAIGLDELLRVLEQSNDDRAVEAALRNAAPLVRDAASGKPMPAYYYRLVCGHLIVVWTTPLPTDQTELFCERCQRVRGVVEQLAG